MYQLGFSRETLKTMERGEGRREKRERERERERVGGRECV